jgi:hypothetical protein
MADACDRSDEPFETKSLLMRVPAVSFALENRLVDLHPGQRTDWLFAHSAMKDNPIEHTIFALDCVDAAIIPNSDVELAVNDLPDDSCNVC